MATHPSCCVSTVQDSALFCVQLEYSAIQKTFWSQCLNGLVKCLLVTCGWHKRSFDLIVHPHWRPLKKCVDHQKMTQHRGISTEEDSELLHCLSVAASVNSLGSLVAVKPLNSCHLQHLADLRFFSGTERCVLIAGSHGTQEFLGSLDLESLTVLY